jgi:hypothetical protein
VFIVLLDLLIDGHLFLVRSANRDNSNVVASLGDDGSPNPSPHLADYRPTSFGGEGQWNLDAFSVVPNLLCFDEIHPSIGVSFGSLGFFRVEFKEHTLKYVRFLPEGKRFFYTVFIPAPNHSPGMPLR